MVITPFVIDMSANFDNSNQQMMLKIRSDSILLNTIAKKFAQ